MADWNRLWQAATGSGKQWQAVAGNAEEAVTDRLWSLWDQVGGMMMDAGVDTEGQAVACYGRL